MDWYIFHLGDMWIYSLDWLIKKNEKNEKNKKYLKFFLVAETLCFAGFASFEELPETKK